MGRERSEQELTPLFLIFMFQKSKLFGTAGGSGRGRQGCSGTTGKAPQNETNQRHEEKKAGQIKEPRVMEGLFLRWSAAAVTFVGMMVVLAHRKDSG